MMRTPCLRYKYGTEDLTFRQIRLDIHEENCDSNNKVRNDSNHTLFLYATYSNSESAVLDPNRIKNKNGIKSTWKKEKIFCSQ